MSKEQKYFEKFLFPNDTGDRYSDLAASFLEDRMFKYENPEVDILTLRRFVEYLRKHEQ